MTDMCTFNKTNSTNSTNYWTIEGLFVINSRPTFMMPALTQQYNLDAVVLTDLVSVTQLMAL